MRNNPAWTISTLISNQPTPPNHIKSSIKALPKFNREPNAMTNYMVLYMHVEQFIISSSIIACKHIIHASRPIKFLPYPSHEDNILQDSINVKRSLPIPMIPQYPHHSTPYDIPFPASLHRQNTLFILLQVQKRVSW